jgi:methylase of polypeptide subunit release factors
MSLIERLHGGYVHNRRVRVLSGHLAELLPQNARILDVGCGDGLLANLILQKRPDIDLRGIDVLVREQTYIPVEEFEVRYLLAASGLCDNRSY